jgi:cell wall-associated NlpC family hydrolase
MSFTVEVPSGLGKYYTYMNWNTITNMDTQQGKLIKAAGKNYDADGYGKIGNRYTLAMTSTFGEIGDYVDVYMEDGRIIYGILADEKSQKVTAWDSNPANKWGHENGQCMVEWVVNWKNHDNPKSNGCVLKVINQGSYFSDSSYADTGTSDSGTTSSDGSSVSTVVARPIIITKKYEYYSGQKNSNVISFTPEYQGMCVSDSTVKSAYSVDTVKNEMIECSIDNSYNSEKASGKIMGLSSSSFKRLESKAFSMWSMYSSMKYGATLEILGDPTVKVGSYCYVMVYTKYGLPHHTSGIYYIKSADDSISGGTFITTLTLLKVGTSVSNVEAYVDGLDSTSSGSSNSGDTTGGAGVASNADVENAVLWAIKTANDDTHGYVYGASHGTEGSQYDCSSFVGWAFKHAGFNVSIVATGSMRSVYTAIGFVWHPAPFSVSDLQRGDILLNENSHVELYIGGGQKVGAHSNYDGKDGDSQGNEISIGDYSNSSNWDGYLRYGS